MGDDGELGRRSFRPLYGVMVARLPLAGGEVRILTARVSKTGTFVKSFRGNHPTGTRLSSANQKILFPKR